MAPEKLWIIMDYPRDFGKKYKKLFFKVARKPIGEVLFQKLTTKKW